MQVLEKSSAHGNWHENRIFTKNVYYNYFLKKIRSKNNLALNSLFEINFIYIDQRRQRTIEKENIVITSN